jgi:DNA-directed RNA polymerase subunit alpha
MKRISLRDLIKPKKVDVVGEEGAAVEIGSVYGKFVVEPLERGFGLTLGNSLRRILLSSLQGSAIVSVQIDGVMHEFSTLSGVLEDVTEIILNLKGVVTLLEDKEEATIKLDIQGSKEIKAGDFVCDPAVKVLNKDWHIATLSEGARFVLEAKVKTGRGFVTSERNKLEEAPMGTIFLDSIFSPIRRVNHLVSNARVGQRTDYDKLVLEVWTNGSITPRAAVAQAAHILVDQLGIFVGDNLIVEEEEPQELEPKRKLNDNLFKRIEEVELSVRSANCLDNADIKYIGELVQKSEAEMLRTKNFGRKSLNEIKEILGEMGLALGMKLEEFPGREALDASRLSSSH